MHNRSISGRGQSRAKPMAVNEFLVGATEDEIIVQRFKPRMSKEEALNFAAWLVVVAATVGDDGDGETQARFDELYAEAIGS
jgi:hypothetical protein